MKKQILPDGTIVLEGSPQELVALETGLAEDGEDRANVFDDGDEYGHDRFLRQLGIRDIPRDFFGHDGRRVWMDDRNGRHHVRYGGTHGIPRSAEALQEEVTYLKDEIQRHHKTEHDLRQESRDVAAKWQAEEAKVAKLERQLAKAMEQGFDPDKKSEYKTEIVTEKGTTIYFKVLKAGSYAGKVAQHYKGGSYLHNGDIHNDYYLENYAAAGVDPDDRIPYGYYANGVLAPSEQEVTSG